MVTPLTLYGTNQAAATVATCNTLVTSTGGGVALNTNLIGTATGYGEIWSQGNAGAWPAAGSLGGVGPHGWLLDTTLLEGNTLVGGNYTATYHLAVSVGSITADLYERVYVRSSGGVFTQIGTNLLKSGVSITITFANFVWPATNLPLQAFGTGDKLYRQLDMHILTNSTGSGAATLGVHVSNSASFGHASYAQLVTAGYTTGGGGGNPPVVGNFGLLANGTGVASFDHARWTQYPDPSLSLAAMGRVGSSLVSWNSVLPSAAATLQMLVSTDGVNFSDVTAENGGPLPGINPTPTPVQDTYNVDSSATYTSTTGWNGSNAAWVLDVSNTRVTATNGASAFFLYTAIVATDLDLLTTMDESDAGGLVWSYSDAQDYYALAVADASAATGTPNRVTLYKTVAGVTSQLAQATIAFTRTTYHAIRMTMAAGVITVQFDGVTALTYTDATPLPAGNPGLAQNVNIFAHWALRTFAGALDLGIPGVSSTVARFYSLWMQPLGTLLSGNPAGDTVTSTFVYTKEVLATTDNTVTPQVLDMTIACFGPSIGQGALIPTAAYTNTYIGANMDDLSTKSNYASNVDKNLNLTFQGRTYVPAPWVLSVPDPQIFDLVIEAANDAYSNRQVLLGVNAIATITDTITGNGADTAFPLRFKPWGLPPPIYKLNGNPLVGGQKGGSGADWYFTPGDVSIAGDPANTPLLATDVLTVTYSYSYITTVTRDNLAEQARLAAAEGTGTGIVENVTDVTALNLDVPSANAYGDALNARYSIPGRTVTFNTYRAGLAIGQLIPAFIPAHSMQNVQLLITSVDITSRTIRSGGSAISRLVYTVTATENPNLGSWQKRLAKVKLP